MKKTTLSLALIVIATSSCQSDPEPDTNEGPHARNAGTLVPTAGWMGGWELNEGSGTNAADGSGHGNSGVLQNGASWSSGKSGSALSLDGIDDYMRVADSASVDSVAGTISVAAWAKPSGDQSSWRSIVNRQRGTGATEHYFFGFRNGVPEFWIDTSAGELDVNAGSAVATGQWVHLAGTYDGSQMRLYVDGVERASRSVSGPAFGADTTPLTVGAAFNDASSTPSELFTGALDQVLLYNRALSAQEITSLVSGTSAGPPPAPTGLTATCNTAGDQVTVSWTAAPGAESYYLRLDQSANNTASCWYCESPPDYYLDQYGSTTFTGSITPDVAYKWWVHGANTNGIGASGSGSFTCASGGPNTSTPPPAPTGLTATCNAAGDQVTVSWTATPGATSYYLRLDQTANNDSSCWYCQSPPDYYLDQYGSTSFTGSITPNAAYKWWVHGANASGIGASSPGSFTCSSGGAAGGLPRLQVSSDGRYLTKSGSPFFWMGDTAWFLPLLTPTDRDLYLSNTAANGFNGIWVDLYSYGFESAIGDNPFLSDNTDTRNETFWKRVDDLIGAADTNGIYVGLVLSWPYHLVYKNNSLSKIDALGKWLGNRYGSRNNVVWVIAGEYSANYGYCSGCIPSSEKAKFDTMAQAIRTGGGTQLMTIHPGGIGSPLQDFGSASWLDFVLYQTGDGSYGESYASITNDYNSSPTRPQMVGETAYEGGLNSAGTRTDADMTRRWAYWAVFAGAAGHVYGEQEITIFYVPGVSSYTETAQYDWHLMLGAAGRTQMRHLRTLLQSKSLAGRVPDQSLVTSSLGTGSAHIQATRAANGNYAWVYIPDGRAATVNMAKLAAPSVNASWYNPRDGSKTTIGQYANTGTRSFDAPGATATGNDWVLVLE